VFRQPGRVESTAVTPPTWTSTSARA
jgi:hypothetical protein